MNREKRRSREAYEEVDDETKVLRARREKRRDGETLLGERSEKRSTKVREASKRR